MGILTCSLRPRIKHKRQMTVTAFRKVWYCVAAEHCIPFASRRLHSRRTSSSFVNARLCAISVTTRVIIDCTPTKSPKLRMNLAYRVIREFLWSLARASEDKRLGAKPSSVRPPMKSRMMLCATENTERRSRVTSVLLMLAEVRKAR